MKSVRRIKSLAFPVALFVCTFLAACYSGQIADAVDGNGTAGQFISLGLQSAAWITAAVAVIQLVQVFVWEQLVAEYLGAPVPRLIRDMVAGIIMIIAVAGVLKGVFGKEINGILATSGLLGIVLGFSLQTIILDVFTGLAIHFDRPFSTGEWIRIYGEMHGMDAKVLEIN
jgi:small-conductance mechanosensitive channel